MDKKIIQLCCRMVAEKFNQGEPEEWVEANYIALLDAILVETRVMISKNTLKRIFGKLDTSVQYSPQKETKNALAKYIGFEHWQAFVAYAEQTLGQEEKQNIKIQFDLFKILWVVSFITACTLLYFSSKRIWLRSEDNNIRVKLKVESSNEYAPTNIRVIYDIPQVDSLTLIGHVAVPLNASDSLLNLTVNWPDYLWFSIEKNKQVLAKQSVLIKSNNWQTYYVKNNTRFEVEKGNNSFKQSLSIPKTWFTSKLLDTTDFHVSIRNFKDFGLSADSLSITFESIIYSNSKVCNAQTFKMYGEFKHIEFRVAPQYCQQHTFVSLSEAFYSGRNTDFSNLHYPLDQWNKMRVQVMNNQVRMYINDQLSFSQIYTSPVGSLKGIVYDFLGFGEVRDIVIESPNGQFINL